MLNRRIKAFAADTSGNALLENALAVAIIGVAMTIVVSQFGISLNQIFSAVGTAIGG